MGMVCVVGEGFLKITSHFGSLFRFAYLMAMNSFT